MKKKFKKGKEVRFFLYHVVMPTDTITFVHEDDAMKFARPIEEAVVCSSEVTQEAHKTVLKWSKL